VTVATCSAADTFKTAGLHGLAAPYLTESI